MKEGFPMKSRAGKAAMSLGVMGIVAVLVMPVSAQNRRAQSRPVVDLPRGPVRQVILNNCTACHTLERVEASRLTEEKWRDIVTDMKTKGARLDDGDVAPLAEYLTRTYGPQN